MSHLVSVLIERIRSMLKNVYLFLEKHSFFNVLVEHVVKLFFLILVYYMFKVYVW